MGKKKTPKAYIPEMDAMLEGMQELLTDEHGNLLPSDHPQVLKLQKLAEQLGKDMEEGKTQILLKDMLSENHSSIDSESKSVMYPLYFIHNT